MESVAFLLRDNFEMLKSLGVPVNEIRMLGGASHSPLWRQIQADILNTPVAVPECSEAVAMGAAILGAVAAEEFADPVSGAGQWVRTKCVVIPSDDAAEYQNLFADYQRINELLLPTWK